MNLLGFRRHQLREKWIALAWFILFQLWFVSASYGDFKSDIVVDFSETKFNFYYPLNGHNLIKFKVTNRGNKDYYFVIQDSYSGGESKGNPQGQPHLRPGDSIWFRTLLTDIRPGQVGDVYSYNYHIELVERAPFTVVDGDKIVFDKTVTITVIAKTGPVNISGTVYDDKGSTLGATVYIYPEEAEEEFGRQLTDNSGKFSFDIADAADYRLGIESSGYERGFLYVEKGKNLSPYRISLKRAPVWSVKTALLRTLNSFVGFHRITVSKDETKVLLAQGCENWLDVSLKTQSRIYLYDINSGQPIWDRPMGLDSYSSDISDDGIYVVYATGSLIHLPNDPLDFVRLLRGSDGSTIWTKYANPIEFPGTKDVELWHPCSRSVKFSHDGTMILIGMDYDYVYLLNRSDGTVKWKNWVSTNIRETLFSKDDRFVYVPAGQGWIYKFSTDDGREIWRQWAGSWATIGGLCFSPDGKYIAVGTKSGNITLIDAANGSIKFMREFAGMTGYCEFSKDGTRMMLSSGSVGQRYCDMEGNELWNYPLHPTTVFSPDGKWLVNTYNEGTFLDSEGTWLSQISAKTLLVSPYSGWLNSEGTRYITILRDTQSLNDTVLKIYMIEVKSAAIYPPINFSGRKVLNRSLALTEYNVNLTWQPNPASVGVAKYRLYSLSLDGLSHTLLAELGADVLKYTHRKVSNNQPNKYLITAANADGMESPAASLTVTGANLTKAIEFSAENSSRQSALAHREFVGGTSR